VLIADVRGVILANRGVGSGHSEGSRRLNPHKTSEFRLQICTIFIQIYCTAYSNRETPPDMTTLVGVAQRGWSGQICDWSHVWVSFLYSMVIVARTSVMLSHRPNDFGQVVHTHISASLDDLLRVRKSGRTPTPVSLSPSFHTQFTPHWIDCRGHTRIPTGGCN